MALKLSTGLVNKLMDTASFKTIFAGCSLDIYSGVQPASANDVPNGTKLVAVSLDGLGVTGLTFEASATDGQLEKNSSEVWSGVGIAAGTAGWFRLREAGDAGTASSTTACRLDGSISTSGGDMTIGTLTVAIGAPFVIQAGSFTLPRA